MEKDFWSNMNELTNDIKRDFDKSERATYTKTMMDRLRLGREMRAEMTPAGDEYGNYKKFEGENSVQQKDDKAIHDLGYEQYEKNLRKLMEEMKIDENQTDE